MKVPVTNLDSKRVGEIELAEDVFGLPLRKDLLARMVNYQLAKRRQGTHKVKGRSEVRGGGRKPRRQKGTGSARQGTIRAPQFRGGGVVFGPTPRDHALELTKKVRKLALKTALSAKQRDGKLLVLEAAQLDAAKTKDLAARLGKLGVVSALLIDGPEIDDNFALAARNLPHLDLLPEQGANVYDILRHDSLLLTKAAIEHLEARLR
jgi:large subunit ribosomal protein L4